MSPLAQLILTQRLDSCLDLLEEVQRLLREPEMAKALESASPLTRDIAFKVKTQIAEHLR